MNTSQVSMNGYWRLLFRYLRPHWRQAVLLGLLLVCSIGLQLVNPQIVRHFIDAAQTGQPPAVLLMAGVLFIGLAGVQQLMAVGSTYISQNLGWTSTNALRTDLVAHCLSMDMAFHKTYRPGDMIERIDGDVTSMFNFFSNLLVEIISHFSLIFGILVLLFLEDWRIGISMAVFICLAVFVMGRIQAFAVPRHVAVREVVTNFYGFLGEVLGSTEDIRSNGAVPKIIARFRRILRQWLPLQLIASFTSMSMWTSTLAIYALGNTLAFGVGGVLWSRGMITIGTVYLIFHYFSMLGTPLRRIQNQLADLQKAGASIQRIEELLHAQPRITGGTGLPLPPGPLSVAYEGVSFEYDEGDPVLHDLTLHLPPGTVLGVLGRTGSGKTTLARLLARLYDPTRGTIRLGGQPLRELPLDNLRSRVAFVTQDVQLFNASIRDNLTFFDPAVDDPAIWDALQKTGLDNWVRSLPGGLDTMLAVDGGGLSAGEAQLLALVRAFLKDPGLVILDEASSRLDPMTEKRIENALDKLFVTRTALIIAHRLQTIERADQILILEQGRILEHGTRLDLLRNPHSHFSGLLRKGLEEVMS